ncbi:type I restriction endonuclease, partial [Candidatus Venteria ishoeyi]|uniref:type I restriction endonuclease n=1 Tax=Candidatus Venteria ishoeyi TaxID=1899563 RepID=UPI00255CDECC
MSYEYNEDNLVEQATIDVLADMGWHIETAWKNETFGINGLLGRENKNQVILQKYLLPILQKLNPDLPDSAYRDAYLKIAQKEADKTLDRLNKEKYELIKNGVEVTYTNNKG